MAHLGRGASSPSRCSSCFGPPPSASPGRGGARCALRRAASCSCGSAQWLPCRTGPRACPGEGERRNEAGGNGNTARGKLMLPTSLPGNIMELRRPRQQGPRALPRGRIQLGVRSQPGSISHTKSTRTLESPLTESLGPLDKPPVKVTSPCSGKHEVPHHNRGGSGTIFHGFSQELSQSPLVNILC